MNVCRWFGLWLVVSSLSARAVERLYVQIRAAPIRSSPAPFASVIGTLAYGEPVTVIETSGAWRNVRTESPTEALSGWIHLSALTPKALSLQAGADTSVRASSDEVALAGKGFTAQVENQLKTANPHLPFAAIDKMEKMAIPLDDITVFLEKGGLAGKGGRTP